MQRLIRSNGQLRCNLGGDIKSNWEIEQLQEQREFYRAKMADLEKDRECLQEVLKNFLLQRELDKFRRTSDES
jgi:hypothetical protein